MCTAKPYLVEGTAMLEVNRKNRDGSTGSKVVGLYAIRKLDTLPPATVKGTMKHREAHVNLMRQSLRF